MDPQILREAMTVYGAVYNEDLRAELDFQNWVNSLVEEGYDLSEYTWEEMYSGYLTEILGLPEFGPSSTQINKWGEEGKAQRAKERSDRATNQRAQLGVVKTNQGYIAKPGATSYDPEKSSEAIRLANRLNKETGLNKTPATKKPAEPVKPSGNAPTKSPTPTAKPTPTASKPTPTASKPTPTASAQTGDKAKDMATFASTPANKGLAAAAAEKARIRGTQQTDNPLMKSMRSRLPMNSPSVQAPAVAGLGKGNQSLSQNPNAFKAAPPKPVATSTAPEVKATNTIAAKTTPTPVTPKPNLQQSIRANRLNMSFDLFDVVKGHLLDEGYADTEDAALVIMANMSEEWKKNIVEAVRGASRHDTEMRKAASKERRGGDKRLSPSKGKQNADKMERDVKYMDKLTKKNKIIVGMAHEELNIFDVVLEFLQAEGYAETLEEAEWMMANVIDEKAISIVIGEARAAREDPEGHDKEEKKKYAPVRGERTPMPPRGNKRREDFEKWYAANVR